MSAATNDCRSCAGVNVVAAALRPMREATVPLPARLSSCGARINTRMPRSR